MVTPWPQPPSGPLTAWPQKLPKSDVDMKEQVKVEEKEHNASAVQNDELLERILATVPIPHASQASRTPFEGPMECLPNEKKDQKTGHAMIQSIPPTQLDIDDLPSALEPATKRRSIANQHEEIDDKTFSSDEIASFVNVLTNFLMEVKGRHHICCTLLVKNKDLGKLQELTSHIECMELFVNKGPEVQPTPIIREEAHKFVEKLVNFFAEYDCLEHGVVSLQQWLTEAEARTKNSNVGQETMVQAFQHLVNVWEEGWEEQKARLMRVENFTALSILKAIKERLHKWASQEEKPTEHEIVKEFKELQSIPTFKEWEVMDSLLLTTEELMKAGVRQQNLHFLYGMTVELPDGTIAASVASPKV